MDSRRSLAAVARAIVVWSVIASFARAEESPTPDSFSSAERGNSSPPGSEAAIDRPPGAGCDASCCSPWTASAEFIILERIGSVNQTLVSTYPPHTPLILGTGTERLNSNDLDQGFSGGPRLDLIHHGDGGCDLELSYFQIDGWSSAKSVEPNSSGGAGGPPPNWLVFTAPGDFVQWTDYADQAMAWSYATRLYDAELNVRWELCPRVSMLAGFRWVNLREDLQGTLPPERATPFWDARTRNNLYGLQLGEDWKWLNWGRLSIDGLVKAGIFDNNVGETAAVSIYRTVYWESASINHAAFLGEIDLQCKYEVAKGLVLKAGYEAMWLQGVALAPGQIQETQSQVIRPVNVQALGVNCDSGVFYHGATAGLEYSF